MWTTTNGYIENGFPQCFRLCYPRYAHRLFLQTPISFILLWYCKIVTRFTFDNFPRTMFVNICTRLSQIPTLQNSHLKQGSPLIYISLNSEWSLSSCTFKVPNSSIDSQTSVKHKILSRFFNFSTKLFTYSSVYQISNFLPQSIPLCPLRYPRDLNAQEESKLHNGLACALKYNPTRFRILTYILTPACFGWLVVSLCSLLELPHYLRGRWTGG